MAKPKKPKHVGQQVIIWLICIGIAWLLWQIPIIGHP